MDLRAHGAGDLGLSGVGCQKGPHLSGKLPVAGDEICVLEAMNMQQMLRADWSGIVKTVHVQAGQQVLDGDAIVDLE